MLSAMLPLNELGTKRGREAKASIPWYCEVFCHETRLIPVCSWIYNVSRNISQDYSTLRLADDWGHIQFEGFLSKCRNHLRDIWALDLGRVFAIVMSLSAKKLRLRAITSKISRLSSSLAKMIYHQFTSATKLLAIV